MKKATIPLHEDRLLATSRRVFRQLCPDGEERRAAEIAALPQVEWKGRTLYTIRCHGKSGRGPHDVNVPASLLWQLIDIRAYCCPYHPGEAEWEGPVDGGTLTRAQRARQGLEEFARRVGRIEGVLGVNTQSGGNVTVFVANPISTTAEHIYELEAEIANQYPELGLDVWVTQKVVAAR